LTNTKQYGLILPVLKPASKVPPDTYEAVFGALAHPARRRILLTVYFQGGAMTAGEIAAMFAHAWQTTSRHLRVLGTAGLIRQERRGRMRVYHLERKRLALVSEWLAHFQGPTKKREGGRQDVRDKRAHPAEGGSVQARPDR
jgi:DNA-binding transcriptional ArsR family regulator